MNIYESGTPDAERSAGAAGNHRRPSFAKRRGWVGRSPVNGNGRRAQTRARAAHAPAGVRSERLGRRLLRVIALLVCYSVLEVVGKAVMVLQFLFAARRRRPHAGLQRLGAAVAEYMQAMWRYCTFACDTAPWPFSPWPAGDAHGRRDTAPDSPAPSAGGRRPSRRPAEASGAHGCAA